MHRKVSLFFQEMLEEEIKDYYSADDLKKLIKYDSDQAEIKFIVNRLGVLAEEKYETTLLINKFGEEFTLSRVILKMLKKN